ncbi:MAG: SH3 domain-containing protein [Betaproteobacteria bacterium]|nr:SH3 domain-containing protein [Betaproteobacteria bacterium]MDH3436795.1 SH3 domain-containing protein [Betaproteobacteria bacterium]
MKSLLAVIVSALVALAAAGATRAAEFRSVGEKAVVLYDAPSSKAKKRYVLSQGYPLEVVVAVEGWTKVRDAKGALTWVESKHFGDKRFLLVNVPVAQIRERAGDSAPVTFEAQENVLLELLEVARGGWLRVRHRDGEGGFVKITQVWGA